MKTVGAVVCAALLLAACGGGSQTTSRTTSQTTSWSSLRAVRVTVAQPGLPPPYGRPKTTSFGTPAAVTRATDALNRFHIAELVPPSSSGACAGGFRITIVIVRGQGSPVNLSAYRCAGKTSGEVAGDLAGFLSALGLPGG